MSYIILWLLYQYFVENSFCSFLVNVSYFSGFFLTSFCFWFLTQVFLTGVCVCCGEWRERKREIAHLAWGFQIFQMYHLIPFISFRGFWHYFFQLVPILSLLTSWKFKYSMLQFECLYMYFLFLFVASFFSLFFSLDIFLLVSLWVYYFFFFCIV